MRLLTILLLTIAALSAQTKTVLTFSPQQVGTAKSQLTLWSVTAYAPGAVSVNAAQIYALAAAQKVGHVDAALAATILTTKAAKSVLAITVQALGAGSALTAVGTIIKNGGVVSTGTASKIQNAAIVAAGVAAIALPYLQKATPAAPNSAIASLILGSEMKLGSDGSGSALFYSLPSTVGAFTAVLP